MVENHKTIAKCLLPLLEDVKHVIRKRVAVALGLLFSSSSSFFRFRFPCFPLLPPPHRPPAKENLK